MRTTRAGISTEGGVTASGSRAANPPRAIADDAMSVPPRPARDDDRAPRRAATSSSRLARSDEALVALSAR